MKKFIIYSLCTIVVVVGLYIIYYYGDNKVSVKFDSCIDGDTIWLNINNKREKVRLLGIDAPEIEKDNVKAQYYGDEAREYLCMRLENAGNISVMYDINSKKYDKYGRVLAWVFIDGDNINIDLVSKGYARVRYIYDDYKYVNDLCIAQDRAYNDNLGIWKNDNSYNNNYCIKNKIVDN